MKMKDKMTERKQKEIYERFGRNGIKERNIVERRR